ncbi:MAG: flagellar L-ring protein precursor FlgH [Rhodobacteraceae bacterium HLUCCO18]|nr:MAG: flagellar L-ring protein precursor FlgH [Rhodobacteraceae bacterium HLUCCO18]
MNHINGFLCVLVVVAASGCARLQSVGQVPQFTSPVRGNEVFAMTAQPMAATRAHPDQHVASSLWTSGRQSLLGDRRAGQRGDILTVVIAIDDSAEFSNSSERGRSGSERMGVTGLFGLPQRIDEGLPDGASMADAVGATGSSNSSGSGAVRRNEQLTLRVAATVTDLLDNGILRIEGSQEVRVNYEIRELLVSGYVRPEDISRQNEIAYDRIAAARISYGGRGHISDVQQPRLGQQVADIVLPF